MFEPPAEKITVGQVVADGRYELLEVLGRGGLATVFRARDRRDGGEVALKVLCDRYVNRPERAERLRREYEYAMRIDHPAVVAVGELGRLDDGRPYFSMEVIDGRPLSRVLSGSGGLSYERTRRLARAIAVALDACHEAGVVHRDLKPDNVLVLEDDRIKLIDFGMAGDADAPAVPAGHQARLTRVNDLLGTHEYMAPEQVIKAPPQRSMDVFALGVVMYEMLSSITPYSGMRPREYVELQINGDPCLRSAERWARIREAPVALAELIDDCRRRECERRPASMREVIERLDMLEVVGSRSPVVVPIALADLGVEAAPVAVVPRRSRRRRMGWGAACGAAAAAVLIASWGVAAWDARDARLGEVAAGELRLEKSTASRDDGAAVMQDEASLPQLVSVAQGDAEGHAGTEPRSVPEPSAEPQPKPAAPGQASAPAADHRQARSAMESKARRASQRPSGRRPSALPGSSDHEKNCAVHRKHARSAFSSYRWTSVLTHTRDPKCWSGDDDNDEYLMMRTEALMESGRWSECVRTGRRSSDPSVRRHAQRCQMRLDTISDTP